MVINTILYDQDSLKILYTEINNGLITSHVFLCALNKNFVSLAVLYFIFSLCVNNS